MSNVVAAAAMRKGVFNLTHTGIAAELTAASEQRLPPVGGRCRIATKRGVQGSEAGAVVGGMRTPLQGVKHTLGTTTRDRAAVRLHLEYHMPFMDKKPGRGTRSGALLRLRTVRAVVPAQLHLDRGSAHPARMARMPLFPGNTVSNGIRSADRISHLRCHLPDCITVD